MSLPQSNRAYDPVHYDSQFVRGRDAALAGSPREPSNEHGWCFHYSFSGGAWFDGYDSVMSTKAQVNTEGE